MRIETIRTLEELQPHADAWNRLAFNAPQRSPILSHGWVSAYLEHLLAPGQAWFCLLALDAGELVGVLPVVTPARWPLLGGRFKAPDDFDVRIGDVLAAEGREAEAARAMFDRLQAEPHFSSLRLNKLPPASPFLQLGEFLPGFRVFPEPDGQGSFFRIEGSFDAYFASLGKKFRSSLRRAEKRIDQLADVETVFLSGEDAGEEHLRAFFELEHSGWKGRTGSSILSCPHHTAFFTALTRRLGKAGMLEWHFLKADGRLLAGSMAMRTRRKLTGWKLAYEEGQASNSPGGVLILRLLRRAYQARDIDELDVVTDFSWYDHWRVERRPYTSLWVSSPRLSDRLCASLSVRARAAVRALRLRVKESPLLSPLAYRVRELFSHAR